MKLDRIYNEVEKRLGRIDFSKLKKGFHPFRFALYNDSDCVFDGKRIERPKEFMANTAVEYNGELVAIWNLMEEPADLDSMTASMVHEMFHAYQREMGESRWPDENAALMRYEYSAENISMKLEEARLIREGNLPALKGSMKARMLKFPYEFDYEARTEETEGSACFIELSALEQLDPEKAEKRWEKLYEEISDPKRYLPVRIISYSVGAALLRLVGGADSFGFDDKPFAVKLAENAAPAGYEIPTDPFIAEAIAAFKRETEETVERALEKNEVLLKGKYPLVSLNIYNARRKGRFAVSTFFIAYMDGCETRMINGDVVAELDGENNVLKVYRM